MCTQRSYGSGFLRLHLHSWLIGVSGLLSPFNLHPYFFLLPILLQSSCMLLLMHELFVCPFMSHAALLAALCCMIEASGVSQHSAPASLETKYKWPSPAFKVG